MLFNTGRIGYYLTPGGTGYYLTPGRTGCYLTPGGDWMLFNIGRKLGVV